MTDPSKYRVDYFDGDTVPVANSGLFNLTQNAITGYYSYSIYGLTFLATWKDVVSDFQYDQEINNAGSQLKVTLARNSDSSGEGTDLNFDFQVQVFQIDQTYPNGTKILSGKIVDYTVDENTNKIDVLILGYGIELDQYIYRGGAKQVALMPIYTTDPAPNVGNHGVWYMQEIVPTATITVAQLVLRCTTSQAARTLQIYKGDPRENSFYTGNSTGIVYRSRGTTHELVGSSTSASADTSVPTKTTFNFNNLKLFPSFKYYYEIFYADGIQPDAFFGADPAGGVLNYSPIGALVSLYSPTHLGTLATQRVGGALYTEINDSTGSTTKAFNSVDPSMIVRAALDDYQLQGGYLTYDTTTVPLTGTTVSYTFKSTTVFEMLKKALELAPVDWYFYVDQGTNKFYFKQKSATPQHTFIIGKHFTKLSYEKRTNDVINVVYFTGGDIGGTNLFKTYSDPASIALYGRRLLSYSDNRVTLSATADLIAKTILLNKSAPEIRVPFEVLQNYPIDTIRPGDVVTFKNSKNVVTEVSTWDVGNWDEAFWDFNVFDPSTYVLQIARFGRDGDSVNATLSTIPPDVNKRMEDIGRNLEKEQTLNNPDAPTVVS